MYDYEKLGSFYLGREYDQTQQSLMETPVLYDAKDLTTHAVIVGMTGSGKTGLGVTLLEEAAIDGIPAIVIDPKGDMGNLLLNFPQLAPADFRPWIEKDEATRKGMTQDEYATQMSQLWRNGLTNWSQPLERVQRLRDAAEAVIYTPGSDAGLSLTVLKSLDAPPPAVLASADAMRERVTGAVSGLLTLLGIDADPLRSREHILVSSIVDHAWREGRSLDLAGLIREVQQPPMKKIGIMDVETIFPASDRLQLAMTINNVLGAPGFAAWMEGEPLNIQRMFYTADGKPRLSIVSIAHLNDQERMFFVTILLNELITWMRSQPGTSSLRALLYMDEVFGYLPPTANPPSKTPMLTLLKQARAFGLGLVLATQNPVDLDYKALSNAGTWFLGRLQTERDKARVLDGLEGASASAGSNFDRKRTEQILSGLSSRVFLMSNAHEDHPVVYQTRWALSYLRGPLTREQIQGLMQERRQEAPTASAAAEKLETVGQASSAMPDEESDPQATAAPVLPPEIVQRFAEVDRRVGRSARIVYRPALLGQGRLHFVDRKSKLDHWQQLGRLCAMFDDMPRDPWEESEPLDLNQVPLDIEPMPDTQFAKLPAEATRKKQFDSWTRSFKSYLYREERLQLWNCVELKMFSNPEMTEGDFRVTIKNEARERRDLEVEKLRNKYASKIETLRERLRKAEQRVEVEQSQAKNATLSAAVSFGTSVLGALFGRKIGSSTNVSKMGTSLRAAGRAHSQRGDIDRAKENVAALEEEIREMSQKLEDEIDDLSESWSIDELEVTPYEVKPRKSDITVEPVTLLWLPYVVDETGIAESGWESK